MKRIVEDIENLKIKLNEMSEKYGCFSVNSSWEYGDKLKFQCHFEGLEKVSRKYGCEMKMVERLEVFYFYIHIDGHELFAMKDRFHTEI